MSGAGGSARGSPRSWNGSREQRTRPREAGARPRGPACPARRGWRAGVAGRERRLWELFGLVLPPARRPTGRGGALPLTRFVRRGGGCAPGGSRPWPRRSGRRRRIRGRAARERREGAGGKGCRCSRRPGGECRGDLGSCWARAKEGREELCGAGMGGGNVPERLSRARGRCAGGTRRPRERAAVWCLRREEMGGLCGVSARVAPGACVIRGSGC